MTNYETRLRIPMQGDFSTLFFSSYNKLIAEGYERIVIGDRGPYIEFSKDQIKINLDIPQKERWRINHPNCHYVEYRTFDPSYMKVYFQKQLVDYADYHIGYFYISPFELYLNDKNVIIEKLKK